jgi:hemerythrin-like domain-containing protein
MLTSTYALATFSVEQADVRKRLFDCKEHVQANFIGRLQIEQCDLTSAVDRLGQWHQRCQLRKLDRYLIPALRQATHQADALLDEIDSLSALGFRLLGNLRQRLSQAVDQSAAWLDQFCTTMLGYCTSQFERLDKEEGELFTLARQVFSREGWFAMVKQILLNDVTWQVRRAPRQGSIAGLSLVVPAQNAECADRPPVAPKIASQAPPTASFDPARSAALCG